MNKEQYLENVKILNDAAYAYYTLDQQIMSDSMYDKLYFKVKDFEDESGFIASNSPTQRVGDRILEGFEKSKHIEKMYSLNDVFNISEFSTWVNKIKEEFNDVEFYHEPKYDGLSLNLLYENGSLVKATTRGDGFVGEDVTENAMYIKGVPLNIPFDSKVEIRGEVTIFKKDFEKVNLLRIKSGKDAFLNERNAASGSLRSFDSKSVKNSNLRFSPYGLGFYENKTFDRQSEMYQWILSLGFINWSNDVEMKDRVSSDLKQLELDYNKMIESRDSYPMLLDGMVIKVDQLSYQDELGFTSKFPKWAIAFKFPAEEKIATLESVITQVGKTGAITPVALISPTLFEGVTVKRVTLHNFNEIERMNLKIGDKVTVIRSGDVIPMITGVDYTVRDGSEYSIEYPSECPTCGSRTENRLTQDGSETSAIYCSNKHCPSVLKGRLEYAVGKKALDIPGFGESVVSELIDKNFVTKLSDIYSLTEEQLLSLEGFKQRKASKLLSAINSAKNIDAYRLLNALDIEGIGESASKKLVNHFGLNVFNTVDKLSYEELISVEDIGESSAKNYIDFFADNEFNIEVDTLVDIVNPKIEEVNGNKLLGKTFVLTGTMSNPRSFYKKLIEDNGGKVSSSVSKKTTFLVAGEDAGSKLEKAKALNINIISDNELLDMI